MVYCLLSIGIVGYFVWAHHMFVTGMDLDSRAYFTIATSIISIPTSIKVFSYIATFASSTGLKGSTALYSFFIFLVCFIFGGFTGLMLSSSALDIILHDTYFVVGHFHVVLSLASIFGVLTGHYYFMALASGINIFESLGFYHIFNLFIGALLIFFPMHFAGISGFSRRVPEHADVFLPFTLVNTHGTFLILLSMFIFLRLHVYLISHGSSSSSFMHSWSIHTFFIIFIHALLVPGFHYTVVTDHHFNNRSG